MRLLAISLAAAVPAVAITATPVVAATAQADDPAKWIGKKVVDKDKGEIGVVTGFRDGILIVKTDKHEASLPPTSFTHQEGLLFFGMTRDQLNAAIEQAAVEQQAAMEAALAPGAIVRGSAGNDLGTIKEITEEFATITLSSGKDVRIPRAGIAATPNGAVVGISAEELEAQVEQGGVQ